MLIRKDECQRVKVVCFSCSVVTTDVTDTMNAEYVKVLVASSDEIQENVVGRERAALADQLKNAEESEICFIETAMKLLEVKSNFKLPRFMWTVCCQ